MAKPDFSETKKQAYDAVDDILLNLKSAGKTIDNMISEYKETLPNKMNVDLLEDDETYYLRADIPGAPKETVKIEIKEESIIIACEFDSFKKEIEAKLNPVEETEEVEEAEVEIVEEEETEEETNDESEEIEVEAEEVKEEKTKEVKYLVKGRTTGPAKRIIKLPAKVISEEAVAKYDKGTVTLIIPKEPPKTYNVTVE